MELNEFYKLANDKTIYLYSKQQNEYGDYVYSKIEVAEEDYGKYEILEIVVLPNGRIKLVVEEKKGKYDTLTTVQLQAAELKIKKVLTQTPSIIDDLSNAVDEIFRRLYE